MNYHGCKNRETWALLRGLSGTEDGEKILLDTLQAARADKLPAADLAKQIKKDVFDHARADVPEAFRDLVSAALAHVDFNEIADAFLIE